MQQSKISSLRGRLCLLMATTILFFVPTHGVKKEVPQDDIIFGQSAFLRPGSLQLYGELIQNAIVARFNRINEEGGIQGRKLTLLSLDDGGEPKKAAENIDYMRKQKVTMFLGNMGTRSIFKVLPLIKEKKIAMLFPWAGSAQLRQPHLDHLVNGVGLLEPQIKAIVAQAVTTLRITKIAIFHDDSGFGNSNKQMAIDELKKLGVSPVAIANYNRFTLDIQRPARELLRFDPKMVICLATSMPTVKLINYFLEKGHFGTKFIGIDSTMFVGHILRRRGIDFSYASPMPNPKTSQLAIVVQFREDMKKYFPHDSLNILSLAYYIHAAIVTQALKKIVGPITKEKLLIQIQQMKEYNLGGFNIIFNPTTRHAYPHTISILKG